MTEPSQYFKGRTVQEQMNEVIGYVDVRSAEVATNAIAADVAQVHQDMLDADADAQAAAASAAAAAGTLANAVKKTGEASQSIAGDIAVSGNLTGGTVTVPAPVNNTDAANKKYVDDADTLLIPIADINQHAVGLTGNQDPIAGDKTWTGYQTLESFARCKHKLLNSYSISTGLGRWIKLYEIDRTGQNVPQADFFINFRSNGFAIVQVRLNGSSLKLHGLISGNTRTPENLLRASTEDNNTITIWGYFATDDGIRSDCLSAYGSNNQMAASKITVMSSTIGYTIDASGYTDENNVVHTFTRYAELNQ